MVSTFVLIKSVRNIIQSVESTVKSMGIEVQANADSSAEEKRPWLHSK